METKDIAIIGMSSLFAESKDLKGFWNNILTQKNCIKEVPANRWSIDDYFDPDPSVPDKTYCKVGGFIPDLEFNPIEFGLPPNTLEVTDTSQLFGLILAKRALQDAGYVHGSREVKDKTGIILGASGVTMKLAHPLGSRLQYPTLKKIMKNSGLQEEDINTILSRNANAYIEWNENAFPGFLTNIISGRISNRLDFKGINLTVDAACASSLAAVRMAVHELQCGTCDMMLTGGIDIDCSINSYISFSKTPTLSKTNKISPFDKDSDGMLLGEGIGIIVLKRLDDAVRDNDRVYATIKGIGTSSDGKSKSIYAPDIEGQKRAFLAAYEHIDFTPCDLDLIEAHGTGTPTGDENEISLLQDIFKNDESGRKHIALGSVKSQIGHTKSAAGVAGLIKTSLGIYNQIIPPTINVVNPREIQESNPLYINTAPRPWITIDNSRKAGVSSYGFGGTNFHVVLESFENQNFKRTHQCPQTLIFHDINAAALSKQLNEHLHNLQSNNRDKYYQKLVDLETIAIPNSNSRIGFIAQSVVDCTDLLEMAISSIDKDPTQLQFHHPRGIYYYANSFIDESKKVVALFTGQGSSYLDMGKSLALNFPELRSNFALIDSLFRKENKSILSDKVYPIKPFSDKDEERNKKALLHTEYSQAAIGTISFSCYELFTKAGFNPDITAGHSFGELMALYAGGVISKETYFALIKARGSATRYLEKEDGGLLLAVKGNTSEIKEIIPTLKDVSMANENSSSQLALAGSEKAIMDAKSQLESKGFNCIVIQMPAFHSHYVDKGQAAFSKTIMLSEFSLPSKQVFSNITANCYPNEVDEIKTLVSKNMRESVLFKDEIEQIYNEGGSVFVEFGPKNILTNLVKDILADKPHIAVSVINSAKKDSDTQLREAALQLRLAGLKMNHIDCYSSAEEASDKDKKKSSILLSASSYISDKTSEKIDKALNDFVPLFPSPENSSAGSKSEELYTHNSNTAEINKSTEQKQDKAINNSISDIDSDFTNQTLRVHEAFLNKSNNIVSRTLQLFEKQEKLLSSQLQNKQSLHTTNEVLKHINTQLSKIQDFQTKSLRTHELFINTISNQLSHSYNHGDFPDLQENLIDSNKVENQIDGENSEIIKKFSENNSPNIHVQSNQGLSIDELKKQIICIISEKTGYPAEMIDENMNLESDLGIDSLKKSEIFGAIKTLIPGNEEISTNQLIEYNTIQEIVLALNTYTRNNLGNNATNITETSVSDSAPTPVHRVVLDIISAKTGYPVEMLDNSMSLESDLGIDSLKKTEIFGAIKSSLPGLVNGNASQLIELMTIGEIIDGINNYKKHHDKEVQSEYVNPQKQQSIIDIPAISHENVYNTIVKIISNKTGYPEEMLDESMELESDLGIDSLKKLEIANAIKELFPTIKSDDNDIVKLQKVSDIISFILSTDSPDKPNNITVTESDRVKIEANITTKILAPKKLPNPDKINFIAQNEQVILFAQETSVCQKFFYSLKEMGFSPIILTINEAIEQHTDLEIHTLHNTSIQELLNKHVENKNLAGFISILPQNVDNTTSRELIAHHFTIAKELNKFYLEKNDAVRKFFITVTLQDGNFGFTGNSSNPYTSCIGGLVKSLNHEWKDVFCRTIDISPDLLEGDISTIIINELLDPETDIVEIALKDKNRYYLSPENKEIIANEAYENADNVFLVSGGARGITAQCILKLAKKQKATFIIVGRTPMQANTPHWFNNSMSDAEIKSKIFEEFKINNRQALPKEIETRLTELRRQYEVNNTIKLLEAENCRAFYLNEDFNNTQNLISRLKELEQETGKITGIIHGAGVLSDKLIESKLLDDFEKVFSTKVDSIYNFLEAWTVSDLKHIIFFSSTSSVYGNAGQTDYAVANEFLNKYAHHLQKRLPTCNVASICWGPWEGGMVQKELKSLFESKGIGLLPIEEGTNVFVNILYSSNDFTNIIVSNDISDSISYSPQKQFNVKKTSISRKIDINENKFLYDHMLNGKPVVPATCCFTWIGENVLQLRPQSTNVEIQNLQVFKGLILDDLSPKEYFLEIEEIESDISKTKYECHIKSISSKGRMFFNYKATVVCNDSVEISPKYDRFDMNPVNSFENTNNSFYKDYMFHGPSFQGVQKVLSMSETKMVFECRLPTIPDEIQGKFRVKKLNAFLSDVLHQGSIIWSTTYLEKSCLPSSVGISKQYKPLNFKDTFYVTLEIHSASDTYLNYDCYACDEHGNILYYNGNVNSALVNLKTFAI